MFQLRIYTLRSPEALQQYATVHWARHLTTFTTFGVTTHGVWTERSDGANRLVALIRYPPGADPEQLTRHIMTSPEFAADMAGFDVDESSTFSRYCLTRPHSHRFTDNPGVLDMTVTTVAYVLAGLIAAGIIFIGARFIVAPRSPPPATV